MVLCEREYHSTIHFSRCSLCQCQCLFGVITPSGVGLAADTTVGVSIYDPPVDE